MGVKYRGSAPTDPEDVATVGWVQANAGGGGSAPDVITLARNDAPTVPAADKVKLFGRNIGGRMMPAFIGPSGLDATLQPHFGRNKVSTWIAVAGQATPTAYGRATPIAIGSTALAGLSTASLFLHMARIEYGVTTAALGAVAGFRSGTLDVVRGPAAPIGGFHMVTRFGPTTGLSNTNNRLFVGLSSSTANPTEVEPSTLTNIIGVGWDSADANLNIFHNDASGTATKVDLGVNFPVPTTDRSKIYELDLFAIAGGSTVSWMVTDLLTGAVTQGVISTDLPANTQYLAPRGYSTSGSSSAVTGIALFGMYMETDY